MAERIQKQLGVKKTKKSKPEVENPKPEVVIPQEGGIYYIEDTRFKFDSFHAIFLEGEYWNTRYCSSFSSLSEYYKVIYIGQLEDFRLNSGTSDYKNQIYINKKMSGSKYEYWYKKGSMSDEEKAANAFAKYVAAIPGMNQEIGLCGQSIQTDRSIKPWWKFWYGTATESSDNDCLWLIG